MSKNKIKYVTELNDLELSTEEANVFYALEVPSDEEDIFLLPPEGLNEISLVASFDDNDKVLSQNVLDVVISLGLSNVGVIVDIPFSEIKKFRNLSFDDNGLTLSQYLLRFSENSGATISYLPPESDSKNDFKIYKEFLREVVKDLFFAEDFKNEIYPVSNHVQYIINDVASNGKLKGLTPDDEYMRMRFIDAVSEENSNFFKEGIRQGLVDIAGGEKEMELIILYIVSGIIEGADSLIKNNMPHYVKNNKLFEQVNNLIVPNLKEKIGYTK